MDPASLPTLPLREVLLALLPEDARGHGWQAALSRRLGLGTRQGVHDWLRLDRVPARWVDATCDALGADEAVRQDLRRRAGIRRYAELVDEVAN